MKTNEKNLELAQECIGRVAADVLELLLSKNKEYGNAAFEPLGIFSSADPEAQMRVRIDDKLKRIASTMALASKGEALVIHEDTELDLIGYLILMRAWRIYKRTNEDLTIEAEIRARNARAPSMPVNHVR